MIVPAFWVVEVMGMDQNLTRAAELFDVVDSDEDVIDGLECLLARVRESQRAKAELVAMPTGDLRVALQLRADRRDHR